MHRSPSNDSLTPLSEFIDSEVKSQLRIFMAKRDFELNNDHDSHKPNVNIVEKHVPSAIGVLIVKRRGNKFLFGI